jgi:hypothetical protein
VNLDLRIWVSIISLSITLSSVMITIGIAYHQLNVLESNQESLISKTDELNAALSEIKGDVRAYQIQTEWQKLAISRNEANIKSNSRHLNATK